MSRPMTLGIVAALALALSGCGTTPTDRGISGAGIGAAGGAIIGAVTGLTVLEAAVIGTGVGGALGLFTDENAIDLGPPIWRTRAASAAWSDPDPAPRIASAQRSLHRLGYAPGPVDGVMGPRTRAAISAYQSDKGLPADGRLTVALAERLRDDADF